MRHLALFSRYRGMIKRQISTKIVLIKSLCSKIKDVCFCEKQVLNQLKEFRSGRFEHRGNFDPFILGIIYMVNMKRTI